MKFLFIFFKEFREVDRDNEDTFDGDLKLVG